LDRFREVFYTRKDTRHKDSFSALFD